MFAIYITRSALGQVILHSLTGNWLKYYTKKNIEVVAQMSK